MIAIYTYDSQEWPVREVVDTLFILTVNFIFFVSRTLPNSTSYQSMGKTTHTNVWIMHEKQQTGYVLGVRLTELG